MRRQSRLQGATSHAARPSPRQAWLILLLAWMAVLPGISAVAAEPGWVRRHFGTADGLPVGSSLSAQIDADGFLWIATHDGLARFDGRRFDVHDSMRFPAMSGNRVQSVHVDRNGRVYALTALGDWLSVRSGAIEGVVGEGGTALTVSHVDAASLCLTTQSGLHCPDGQGAFPLRAPFPAQVVPILARAAGPDRAWMLDDSGDVWEWMTARWKRVGQLPGVLGMHAPATAIVADDGSLWIGLRDAVYRYAVASDPSIPSAPMQLPGQVLQLRQGPDGAIWIGTVKGLHRIVAGQAHSIVNPGPAAGINLSWHAPDGALWVRRGTDLLRFPPGSVDVSEASVVLEDGGEILDLLFADGGAVWVMTLRNGLHQLMRPRVQVFGSSSRGGDNVYGVTQGSDGTIWAGTLGKGLVNVTVDGEVRHLGRGDGLPGDNPWLVATAPSGGLYVATYAPGLWYRASGSDRFQSQSLPAELHGEQVLSISFDARGRMWLGTSAGLWVQGEDGWRRRWPDQARRVRIHAVAHSDEDVRWFGGAEGVWRESASAVTPVAADLLGTALVRDLYLDSESTLWISTEGRGLIRVAADDADGRNARQLGRVEGLSSNTPHAVREDASGHLWINSNQGIMRLTRANLAEFLSGREQRLSPLVLGLADGLTNLEGNGGVQPSATLDAAGHLWFPSQHGVVRITPRELPIHKRAATVVIDQVETEGRPLDIGLLQQLPKGVRNLAIRFSAADLQGSGELRFRHRLLPLEDGWTDAPNGRSAGFSGLSPGRYRFQVIAGNSDGIWADTPTTLAFAVPPYWYESQWAKVLAVMLIAIATALVARWRGNRLRQRARDLDRQVLERTDELRREKGLVESTLEHLSRVHAELAQTHEQIAQRNLQLAEQAQRLQSLDRFRTRLFADVSHELRTPVMLVQLPLREVQMHGTKLAGADRDKLAIASRQLDRLAGLVEQLVGLVQAESGQAPLRIQRFDPFAWLREFASAYQAAARRSGVDMVVSTPPANLAIFSDRAHLATIIGNLLDNALKHAPDGSTVELSASLGDELLHVAVIDHGPGFDEETAARLFERFYRGQGPPRQGREGLGIGLALARELVELLGGRITAHSVPGRGARFEVALPLGSSHVSVDELALSAPVADVVAPVAMADRGDGRLLLVEDHPDLAAYLAERLGEYLPVTCVGSAERASAVLAADPSIRLVVSDVMLPGESGVDWCRRQSASGQGLAVPVILVSAKSAELDRRAGLDAGAVAYLCKPFSFEALLDAIARAWPALQPRLSSTPSVVEATDPVLDLALQRLADAEFSIGEWAGLAHLSERQLRRRVTEITGQAPQTWLREQRLLRIRELLRSGSCRTLIEAGSQCGMGNPAYLYRTYRARFGDSP